MTPYPKSVTVKQGDTYELGFRVRERVFNVLTGLWEPGPYRDLTGWTVRAQVKDEYTDEVAAMVFTGVILDQVATPGGVFLKLPGTQTHLVDISPETSSWEGVWDVVMIQPDADEFTYIAGKFKVKYRVSNT